MWGNLDLNQGPTGYESAALTTELLPRMDDKKFFVVDLDKIIKKILSNQAHQKDITIADMPRLCKRGSSIRSNIQALK